MKNKLWIYTAIQRLEDGNFNVRAGVCVAPTWSVVIANLDNDIAEHRQRVIEEIDAAGIDRLAAGIPGLLRWRDARVELPDDETTVMVALANGEVWLGFHVEDLWHNVDTFPFAHRVTHWADLPVAPKQTRAKKGGAA